jgi:4-hydroxybenzoate polyprenyltransferase
MKEKQILEIDDWNSSEKKTSIFDYLFFLRPMLHPPVWTIVILGFYRSPVKPESISILLWLLLLSSGAAGWAYIINQINDIESDRINRKLFFLPDGIISIRVAWIIGIIILAATTIGAFSLKPVLGVLFALGISLGYFYSGPPLFGKNNPYLSTLFNGVAHGLLPFLAGFVGAGGILGLGLIYAIPYFFAVIAVFIGTTLPDIRGDLLSNKITPGAAIGIRYSTVAMTLALMVSILTSLITYDMLFLIVANICLPFYIFAAFRPSEKNALLAIKLAILFLSLAACWKFWPYLFILLGLWIATRMYYRYRFGMVYPKLS